MKTLQRCTPPIRKEGDQSGLGIYYEDSESEHLSQESNTGEESDKSNTDEESDDESNTDEEDDEIFNSDDEVDDDVDAETLQKIKIGESVINLITVILPYLNEL